MKRFGPLGAAIVVLRLAGWAGMAGGEPARDTFQWVGKLTSFTADSEAGAAQAPTDVSSYTTDLVDNGGEKVGREECACVATTKDAVMCTGTFILPDGQIMWSGPYNPTVNQGVMAVTGGTGKFRGARGTFEFVGQPDADPAAWDYTVELLGD